MANKIEYDKFLEVLDTISEDVPDTMRLNLFINDYEENGTIYGHVEKVVLADFRQDIVVIENDSIVLDISEKYMFPVIKRAVIDKVEEEFGRSSTKVYDNMIAGYIDKNLLLANICKSFGVSLSSDFNKVQPEDYEALIGYIDKYYELKDDQTKYPFGAKKVNGEYKTYVAGKLLYDIAQYLVNRGIFSQGGEEYEWSPILKLNHIYPLIPTYNTDDVFNYLVEGNTSYSQSVKEIILAMYNYAKSEGLTGQDKVRVIGASAGTTGVMTIWEIPRDGITLHPYYWGLNGHSVNTTGSSSATHTESFYYDHQDFEYKKHTINYSNGTITKNTQVLQKTDLKPIYTTTTGSIYVINFGDTTKKVYKYGPENSTASPHNRISTLDLNAGVDFSSLYKMNMLDFAYTVSVGYDTLNNILENLDVDIQEDDLIIYNGAYNNNTGSNATGNQPHQSGILYVIRGLKTGTIKNYTGWTGNSISDAYYTQPTFYPQGIYQRDFINTLSDFYSKATHGYNASQFKRLESNDYFSVDKYICESRASGYTYSEVHEMNLLSYDFKTTGLVGVYNNSQNVLVETASDCNIITYYNLGYIEEIEHKTFEGYELEDGAIYPTGLTQESDLKTIYDVYRNYGTVNSVIDFVGVDEERYTPTQVKDISWLPMSVVEVNSQAEAQGADISEDNFDIIIKNIEDAESDNDDEETKNKPKKNIGNTPDIPDAGDLLDVIGNGLIKQYYLTAGDLQGLHDGLFGVSIASIVSNVFGNPLDMIMNFQLTYLPIQYGDSEVVKVGPWELDRGNGNMFTANVVSSQYVFMDFGSIDLNPYFDNYTDYTNTTGTLYLPGCGSCNIDLAEFMTGKMKLVATADTLTGSIVYFLQSLKDGTTQTLYTFNGQVNANIPLTGANYGRMVGDLLKNGISTGVSIATHTPAIKTTTEAGGTILSTHDNTTSEGAHNVGESLKEYGGKQTISTGEKPGISLPQAPNLNVSRGSISGNNSIVAPKVPYLIVKRNAEYNPTNIPKLSGLASNNYITLGTVSGLVKVKECHVQGLNATQEEKSKIDALLKGGIII